MYVEGLNLFEIPGMKVAEEQSNNEDLFRILLIVVTVIFATICTVLIVAFIFRTRSLNRQLRAYSASDIDSAPNLNRKELPSTNVFSVEGSNPAIHHDHNNYAMRKALYDEESIVSDNSDLIGFEDHPDFVKEGMHGMMNGGMPDNHMESVNVAKIKDIRSNTRNPMANGGTMNSRDLDRDSLTRF